MIKEVGKLFEAITGPGWEMNEETDRLELYNFNRTRKLTYVGWDVGDGDTFATAGISFLNDKGEWDRVFDLRCYFLFDLNKEEVTITATARGKNRPGMPLDYRFDYNNNGRWSRNVGNRGSTNDKRVGEDRLELLPSEDEMPKRIDLVLTANLFVDQMIRGEMERPVLVPEGYFSYEEPEELALGTWAYAPNITAAAKLLATATTPGEKGMAGAINRWVFEQETAAKSGE